MRKIADHMDSVFGFDRLEDGPARVGWCLNIVPSSIERDDGVEVSGVELYFLQQSGGTFKCFFEHQPYFFVATQPECEREVMMVLERKFEGKLQSVTAAMKEDLDRPNHLSGQRFAYLQLRFNNVRDLLTVRSALMPIVRRNAKRAATTGAYAGAAGAAGGAGAEGGGEEPVDYFEAITDMREYDVPYHVRVAIDCELRVGAWFEVTPTRGGAVTVRLLRDMVVKADPRVLAFDIECTKAPLKFPDSTVDQVFMISYMVDGQGYLVINREVVSEDVEDFEYTPRPEYKGPFIVFNEVRV